MGNQQYTWTVGWNRPGEASEEGATVQYLTLATALAGFLLVVESDLRHEDLTPEQREYGQQWLAKKRLTFLDRIFEEERLCNLEGEAFYLGGHMVWLALLPVRR